MLRNGLVKWLRQTVSVCFGVILSVVFFHPMDAHAERVKIPIAFLNDFHSQARPTYDQKHESAEKLGGLARLRTVLKAIRQENPSSLILDAGDWSDGGSIDFTGFGGTASLQMIELLGYNHQKPSWRDESHLALNSEEDTIDHGIDAALVGNHDVINGPDELLRTISEVRPTTPLLAGNVDTRRYRHATFFNERIKPYIIKNVNGVKVAILGVTTFELIYDKFFDPIKVLEPMRWTRKMAAELKRSAQADVVIVLSHNSVFTNKWLAQLAPDVDLVIASHDHVLLTEPVKVKGVLRKTEAWVVEAGSWGHYVGKVNLEYDTETRKVDSKDYALIPVNSQWDEDPEALELVQKIEKSVVQNLGDVFSGVAHTSAFEIPKYGFEPPAARLATAAFRAHTGAELSLESHQFVAAGLHRGDITRAHFFNVVPSIYSPKTQKSSQVHSLWISGDTIQAFLRTVFATQSLGAFGLVSGSGLEFDFNPWLKSTNEVDHSWGITKFFTGLRSTCQTGIHGISNILINGEPLQKDRQYRVALQDSFLLAIQFVNEYLLKMVDFSRAQQESTGQEAWRVVEDYMEQHSPDEIENEVFLPKIHTQRPDLTVFQHWIQASRVRQDGQFVRARLKVQVKNLGREALADLSESNMPKVRLILRPKEHIANRNEGVIEVGAPKILLPLAPDEKQTLVWNDVQLPLELNRTYTVTVEIMGANGITAHSGNLITRWFSMDQEVL